MATNNKPIPPKPKKQKPKAQKAKPVEKAKPVVKEQSVEVETINQALQGLGYIFMLVARGEFTPAQLNKALGEAGLPEYAKVTERSWLNAIQTACKKSRGETANQEPYKVEQLQKDADGITVAYYERERTFDNNNKVKLGKYTMRSKAYFEFAGESWLNQPQELTNIGFFKKCNRYKAKLFGGDLRYWIFNKMYGDMRCVPSIGGGKFIAKDVELYPKMLAFCEAVGIDYRSYTQMADDKTKKSLARDVRGSVSQVLSDIALKITEIMSKDKPRRDSVENAKSQLGECKRELQMMAKLLGFQMTDIESQIKGLEDKINGVTISTPAQTRKAGYKAKLTEWTSTEQYLIKHGVYVIPGEVAQEANIKVPKAGKPLAAPVLHAMVELGLLGSYHGENLVIKEIKETQVDF